MTEPFIEDEMTRAKRGIDWVRLEDALGGTGCPVCTQIEAVERHYLEGMLYEYVLDVGVRKKLHKLHGFCTRHAKLAIMTEVRLKSDGLHLATMFETVVQENIGVIEEQAKLIDEIAVETNKRKKRKAVRSAEAGKCFVCDFLRDSEDIAVHSLLRFAGDDEFIEKYAASRTLICFRHIEMLVKEKVSTRVLNASVTKVKRIQTDLLNFIDKHDYQKPHDYTQAELDSYLDVVNFFSGQMRL